MIDNVSDDFYHNTHPHTLIPSSYHLTEQLLPVWCVHHDWRVSFSKTDKNTDRVALRVPSTAGMFPQALSSLGPAQWTASNANAAHQHTRTAPLRRHRDFMLDHLVRTWRCTRFLLLASALSASITHADNHANVTNATATTKAS